MSEMKVFMLAQMIHDSIVEYERASSAREKKFWKEEATKLSQELEQLEQGKGD